MTYGLPGETTRSEPGEYYQETAKTGAHVHSAARVQRVMTASVLRDLAAGLRGETR